MDHSGTVSCSRGVDLGCKGVTKWLEVQIHALRSPRIEKVGQSKMDWTEVPGFTGNFIIFLQK